MNDLHTFAIGDIHGRADLLKPLLTSIITQSFDNGWAFRVVFLGDIIDRGPMSLDALRLVDEHLMEFPEFVLIRGNHDWFPIRILDEIDEERQELLMRHWIDNLGGDATIRSMGYLGDELSVSKLRQHFPTRYLDMIRRARPYVEMDDYVLVHAGVKPGTPLQHQTSYDLMWIREPFLSTGGMLGKRIVHGHTVTASRKPEIFKDRVALDSGAYETGNLTGVHIFPDATLEFLSSTSQSVGCIEPHLLAKIENKDAHSGLRCGKFKHNKFPKD